MNVSGSLLAIFYLKTGIQKFHYLAYHLEKEKMRPVSENMVPTLKEDFKIIETMLKML